MMFFPIIACKVLIKFIDEDGLLIDNLQSYSNFITVINTNNQFPFNKVKSVSSGSPVVFHNTPKIFLKATNHEYSTSLNLFEDPCIYKLTGIFRKASGQLNICNGEIEFEYLNERYKMGIEKKKGSYDVKYFDLNTKSFDISNKTNVLDNKISLNNKIVDYNEVVGKLDASNSNKIVAEIISSGENIGTTKHEEITAYFNTVPYKIDVFIFNNETRIERLSNLINKNTNEIFRSVRQIFQESGMKIEPRLAGILNMRETLSVNEKSDPLLNFKNTIEPLRFSPFNLYTPLSDADLIILLSEQNQSDYIHGMTYYGGSSRLDSSYSVVFTSPEDSVYFISKKIAHEIGHSLGATHDDLNDQNNKHGSMLHSNDSIMESVSCANCKDKKRFFSDFSKNQIYTFIKNNLRLFNKVNTMRISEDQILRSKEEAIEYADERRKHPLENIIKSRLNGRIPLDGGSEFVIFLMMIFYSVAVLILLFYWK